MPRLVPTSPKNMNLWDNHVNVKNLFYAVIDLVFESYYEILKEKNYEKYPKEDILRNGLVKQMKKNKKLQCIISKESAVDDENDVTKGRMDITVYFNYNEENYFCFECKRVSENTWTKNIKQLYINQGLMDYINLKYSENLNIAGMIAFVEEGNISNICSNISEAVQGGCSLCNNINYKYVYNSNHLRKNSTSISVYHLILDYSNIIK